MTGSELAGPTSGFLGPEEIQRRAPGLAEASSRLMGLDAIRVVATLGVVWFHSIECGTLRASGVLGRSSVSFYTMAAMVFLVVSSFRRQRPWRAYAKDRFKRLYWPLMGWGAITAGMLYGLSAIGAAMENPQTYDLPRWSWNVLVDGGTLHLWFLPFLLITSVGVYPAAIWMQKSRVRQWWVAGGCVVIALLLDLHLLDWAPIPNIEVVRHFFALSIDRWSAIYWGVAVAIVWCNGLALSRWRWALAGFGAAVLAAVTVWQWQHGLSGTLKTYGGLGLLLIAMAPWDNAVVRFLAPWGRMSAGVYFAHMAAIYTTRLFIGAAGGRDGDWARDVVTFIGAVLISFPVIALCGRVPGLQWLAGFDAGARKRQVERVVVAVG